jgi:Mrp family chromosome partitioning ATPase
MKWLSLRLHHKPLETLSMNVLVFASRKGGSGKSTLAAHLAA